MLKLRRSSFHKWEKFCLACHVRSIEHKVRFINLSSVFVFIITCNLRHILINLPKLNLTRNWNRIGIKVLFKWTVFINNKWRLSGLLCVALFESWRNCRILIARSARATAQNRLLSQTSVGSWLLEMVSFKTLIINK